MTEYGYHPGLLGGGAAGLTVDSNAVRLGARTSWSRKNRIWW